MCHISCTIGEPQSFNLKFKRAEDYPIDLYYLMDLSYSMKDDLENVKNLGTSLMLEMSKITSDFRIGEEFIGFVTKVVFKCHTFFFLPWTFVQHLFLKHPHKLMILFPDPVIYLALKDNLKQAICLRTIKAVHLDDLLLFVLYTVFSGQ